MKYPKVVVELINIDTWNRKSHFDFYKAFQDPYFNICSSIDVTSAVNYAKQHDFSIFLTLLYLSAQACNQVEAFKLRLTSEQGVAHYNKVQPSATLLTANNTFTFCNFNYNDNLQLFIEQAEMVKDKALLQEGLTQVNNKPEQIFHSIIPWLNFTGYKHASNGNSISNPKIVFGKINEQRVNSREKRMMPVSVELHHALADGIDVAKYISKFQNNIDSLK